MDGSFVPNISFGQPVLTSIRQTTEQVKDVHLMVDEPIRQVESFAAAGADILTVHYEACSDVAATIREIRKAGMKAGLTIKPGTDLSVLEDYLETVDMILLMSVEPGKGGQSFIPATLERIRTLREQITATERAVDIEVDGGIYQSNVREVLDAGANVIVSGSAVFHGNISENTRLFREIMKEYE